MQAHRAEVHTWQPRSCLRPTEAEALRALSRLPPRAGAVTAAQSPPCWTGTHALHGPAIAHPGPRAGRRASRASLLQTPAGRAGCKSPGVGVPIAGRVASDCCCSALRRPWWRCVQPPQGWRRQRSRGEGWDMAASLLRSDELITRDWHAASSTLRLVPQKTAEGCGYHVGLQNQKSTDVAAYLALSNPPHTAGDTGLAPRHAWS